MAVFFLVLQRYETFERAPWAIAWPTRLVMVGGIVGSSTLGRTR
jgi:hypothetical protein